MTFRPGSRKAVALCAESPSPVASMTGKLRMHVHLVARRHEPADGVGLVEADRDRLLALRDGAGNGADQLRRLHELVGDDRRAGEDVAVGDLALVERRAAARRSAGSMHVRAAASPCGICFGLEQLVGQGLVEQRAPGDLRPWRRAPSTRCLLCSARVSALVRYFQTRTPAIAANTTAAIVEMIRQLRTRSPFRAQTPARCAAFFTPPTRGVSFRKVQSVTDVEMPAQGSANTEQCAVSGRTDHGARDSL